MSSLKLYIAQGFGVGRIPWAPGTFGSLVGLAWVLMLVGTGHLWFYLAGMVAGLALSIWLCGAAEKILGKSDPGSVVLDEIVAMPICFLPWLISLWTQQHDWPHPQHFLVGHNWIGMLLLFALFRLFDIFKPWPIGPSQHLAGGWGVTVDDVLAAVYVALLSLIMVV